MFLGIRNETSALPVVGVTVASKDRGELYQIRPPQVLNNSRELAFPVDLPAGEYEVQVIYPSATDRSKRPPVDIYWVQFE